MMRCYDESVEINHNPNWLYISDHPYRTLIVGGVGSAKINVFIKLLKHQRPHFDNNLFLRQRYI